MQRKFRVFSLVIMDIFLLNCAYFIATFIIHDFSLPEANLEIFINNVIVVTLIKLFIFYYFKLYNSLWEYASIEELMQIGSAVLIANFVTLGYLSIKGVNLPIGMYVLLIMIDTILIGSFRLSYRTLRRIKNGTLFESGSKKRVMIIGAGDAGAMVIKELNNHTELNSKPIALIDDDIKKEGKRINGVPILGQRVDIYSTAYKNKIDEIIIAIPSAKKKDISEIVEECKKTNCKTKILPGVYELIDGNINLNQLRDVEISDLLGRDEVKLEVDEINEYLEGKKVLVTGGGGSIGSELCRQIAKFKPLELVILDIYENNAYDIQNELKREYKDELNLSVVIASVRDAVRMVEVMEEYIPDVVFHAAAHKHVPLMEDNPKEAMKNNVFGTYNVASAAHKIGVDRFVLISTDKAVNPTNIMGASKRMCEMIVQSINETSYTEFVAVRFGNVLGSNGSVIPLFKRLIKEGGPVTVTHPDIIRYFMTIPEASQLVLQAGSMANGGEIFVLDMGEPVKILNLAEDLIKLSGLEPYEDIDIKFTGLRPGEKLYEELLMDDEGLESTRHKKIFIGKPLDYDFKFIKKKLHELEHIITNDDNEEVFNFVEDFVPTYNRVDNTDINEELKKEIATAI